MDYSDEELQAKKLVLLLAVQDLAMSTQHAVLK